ncbi:MAG: hypothetical protein JW709_13805 [Sedimentisphaerales bacterium]|nr:hypothetical protein [Sedimentisphaerales bacterium]
MVSSEKNNPCRTLRKRFGGVFATALGRYQGRLARHVASCPRCQRRLARLNRVNLALELLRNQVCKLDLLMRANTQTIGVLQRGVRQTKRAEQLRHEKPRPSFYQRIAKCTGAVANAAACFLVLLLMRTGIYSSMEKAQETGQKGLHELYARNLGEETADDIVQV